jgi:DNA-binding CsgD family transcriptional regulator/tetratricopeptide (TPR) repeat protein
MGQRRSASLAGLAGYFRLDHMNPSRTHTDLRHGGLPKPNRSGIPCPHACLSPQRMNLLERQIDLDVLARRRESAALGQGHALLVCGEAGIGKSALLSAFLDALDDVVVLRGYCDALATPQALGPVLEMWSQLRGASTDISREQLFSSFSNELRRATTLHVLVMEDLHWADEATLDFVRYIGRRLAQWRCLLLVTFRDDEIGPGHALRRVLGDLSDNHVSRVKLAPLSAAAVAQLANAAGQDGERVYSIAGGNAFFVRELLSAPAGSVPASVRDSMLAKLARCSAAARQVSEHVALMPGRMDMKLLASLLGTNHDGIDECIERGILIHERGALAFRHELARRAVEDSLPPARSQQSHAMILAALLQSSGEVGRIVHHARAARDEHAVLNYAPQAGQRAAAMGAHREAAEYYAAAIEHAQRLEPLERVALYERHAYECYLTSQIETAIASALRVLELWRASGDRQAEARTLRFLSRQYWFLGDRASAERHAIEAVAMHERFPPDRDLAMAYSNCAQLAMLRGDAPGAIDFGTRAIDLAKKMNDVEIESHALNNVGAALLMSDDLTGRAMLERSLGLALGADLHEHAARAYVNLATTTVRAQDVDLARKYLSEGIAYCDERDLDSWTTYLQVYEARFALERGYLERAAQSASRLINRTGSSAITRIPALVVLAQVRMRRGDPGVQGVLDEALEAALPTGELQRIGRVAIARAEHAWHMKDMERVVREADLGLQWAEGHQDAWVKGELLFWKSRATRVEVSDELPRPAMHAIKGEWRASAEAFAELKMPFEQAVMLLEGDAQALSEAQKLIVSIGAHALQARITDALRNVSSNVRASTANNPLGLTKRELQILRLLGDGVTNAELARKLFLSTKTVDHHVSAILGKLQVRSRAHAVTIAHELGIIQRT